MEKTTVLPAYASEVVQNRLEVRALYLSSWGLAHLRRASSLRLQKLIKLVLILFCASFQHPVIGRQSAQQLSRVAIDAASPQNVWRRCGLAAVRGRATTNFSSCAQSLACKEPSPISHEAPEPGAAEIRKRVARILRRILAQPRPLSSAASPISNIIPAPLDGGVGF
ncbi:uncharacterized protein Triagg1_297 [Trichoderma aggressivum f. europaeum]|uniref:Uncharacterized protein n=1 Tax=Trichoderma aggressivum f. europaeum TaxID=173218 RepID=A0AAE1ILY6_9HYPO|nr:hypothetical protein Triagg1_297 [Trichoderma aggressivum f. europaeum]